MYVLVITSLKHGCLTVNPFLNLRGSNLEKIVSSRKITVYLGKSLPSPQELCGRNLVPNPLQRCFLLDLLFIALKNVF